MIRYKIDVLNELKKAGYGKVRLRKEHILGEGTVQSIRERKLVSLTIVDRLCSLLNLGISDILEYIPDEDAEVKAGEK